MTNRSKYDNSRKIRMLLGSLVFNVNVENYPIFPCRKRGGITPFYVPTDSSQKGRSLIFCYWTRSCELFWKDRVIRWFSKEYFFIRLLDRVEGLIQYAICKLNLGFKPETYRVVPADLTYLTLLPKGITEGERSCQLSIP